MKLLSLGVEGIVGMLGLLLAYRVSFFSLNLVAHELKEWLGEANAWPVACFCTILAGIAFWFVVKAGFRIILKQELRHETDQTGTGGKR